MITDRNWLARLGTVLVLIGLGGTLLVSGCNTMRGAGEDISAAGSAVSGGAEDTEEKIEREMQ